MPREHHTQYRTWMRRGSRDRIWFLFWDESTRSHGIWLNEWVEWLITGPWQADRMRERPMDPQELGDGGATGGSRWSGLLTAGSLRRRSSALAPCSWVLNVLPCALARSIDLICCLASVEHFSADPPARHVDRSPGVGHGGVQMPQGTSTFLSCPRSRSVELPSLVWLGTT